MMFKNIIDFHGSERSEPHMKCNACNIYTFFAYLCKKFLRKMQSRRRRSSRTLMFGIYRLITVFIFEFMCYIRRQRHLTEFVKNFLKYTVISKFNVSVSVFNDINYLSRQQSFAKLNNGAYVAFFTRSYEAFPCIIFHTF